VEVVQADERSVITTTLAGPVTSRSANAADLRRFFAPAPPDPTTATTTSTTTTSTTTTVPVPAGEVRGVASWYGTRPGTCASPYLFFGTVVTVTDVDSGASIRCTVDDRQARAPGRVIDLSYDGFAALAGPSQGLVEVRLSW